MTLQTIADAIIPRAMNWTNLGYLLVGLCVLSGILLVYPVLILRKYARVMFNLFDHHILEPENGFDHPTLDGEEVCFEAADAHPLRGIILSENPRSSQGLVIFAHEFGSDRSGVLRYCRGLLDAGYSVLSFDFRGHGESPPEPDYKPRWLPSDRECADVHGAIRFARDWLVRHGQPPRVGLLGVSRGAGACILAAAREPEVSAIVTDGLFSSDITLEFLMRRFATIFAPIRVVAENHPPLFWRFLRWLLFRECARRFGSSFPSVRRAIVRLRRRPILFIHGEKDSYIPISQSQFLYGRARGPKELWIVPGAKHNQCVKVQPAVYAERTVRFFGEHLPLPSAPSTRTISPAAVRPSLPKRMTAPVAAGAFAVSAVGHHAADEHSVDAPRLF